MCLCIRNHSSQIMSMCWSCGLLSAAGGVRAVVASLVGSRFDVALLSVPEPLVELPPESIDRTHRRECRSHIEVDRRRHARHRHRHLGTGAGVEVNHVAHLRAATVHRPVVTIEWSDVAIKGGEGDTTRKQGTMWVSDGAECGSRSCECVPPSRVALCPRLSLWLLTPSS